VLGVAHLRKEQIIVVDARGRDPKHANYCQHEMLKTVEAAGTPLAGKEQ
jgi:hypothetical protein